MSSYTEARQEILLLMSQVRDAIDAAPEDRRDQLWRVAADDLHDAMTGQWSPPALAHAFQSAIHGWIDVARLASDELHSVRVPVRSLRLVTEDEFAEMSYGPKEAS